jgi:hypothetical protein
VRLLAASCGVALGCWLASFEKEDVSPQIEARDYWPRCD